jgi:hypothetical protein
VPVNALFLVLFSQLCIIKIMGFFMHDFLKAYYGRNRNVNLGKFLF